MFNTMSNTIVDSVDVDKCLLQVFNTIVDSVDVEIFYYTYPTLYLIQSMLIYVNNNCSAVLLIQPCPTNVWIIRAAMPIRMVEEVL